MARDSQGARGISGYNPKEGTPAQRVVKYTKQVSVLEYQLYVAKKNLETAEQQLKNENEEGK